MINKAEAMRVAMKQVREEFQWGAVMKLGEATRSKVNSISTGLDGLDRALGIGGLPRSRITEIFGAESSGKTTLALRMIAEAQKENGIAAFIDAEHSFAIKYAKMLGVDIGNLWVSQPSTGEEALDIAERLIRSGVFDIVVIDSVAALVPQQELEDNMGDACTGLHASLMIQGVRRLAGVISRSNTSLVFINQLRERIGADSEVTTGGKVLKSYYSVRIEVQKGKMLYDKDKNTIGVEIIARVVENRVAPPFGESSFNIIYGQGIIERDEAT